MLDRHPCLYPLLAWLAGLPLRIVGSASDILAVALAGDALFFLGAGLAIYVFFRRRSATKAQPIGYCPECGKPLYSQGEMDEHALSHR